MGSRLSAPGPQEKRFAATLQDHRQARRWHEQGVPLQLADSALLLASLRRLVRPADLPPLSSFLDLRRCGVGGDAIEFEPQVIEAVGGHGVDTEFIDDRLEVGEGPDRRRRFAAKVSHGSRSRTLRVPGSGQV